MRLQSRMRAGLLGQLPYPHHITKGGPVYLSNRTHNLRNLEIGPDPPTARSGTQGLIHLKDRFPTQPSGKMSLASIARVPRAAAVGLA